MLSMLQLADERGRINQLLQAAETGGDFLQCVADWGAAAGGAAAAAGGNGADVQQQRQQQLVEFLMRNFKDVKDNFDRNPLHLVATHSFKIPVQARLRQLQQLTGHNPGPARKLMSAGNNNGATPLIVAATKITTEVHAEVFLALLGVADARTLLTKTKTGWNVLHRLASTAADLEAAPPPAGGITAQRVFELMQATQQRVHTVADELESRGTPAAQQIAQKLRDGCLRAPEPKAYYKGSAYMQRLQASALASAS